MGMRVTVNMNVWTSVDMRVTVSMKVGTSVKMRVSVRLAGWLADWLAGSAWRGVV